MFYWIKLDKPDKVFQEGTHRVMFCWMELDAPDKQFWDGRNHCPHLQKERWQKHLW